MATLETVGIDVGGTFTDFVIRDSLGNISIHKRPSTPQDPGTSILEGLQSLLAQGEIHPGFLLLHGTTVATNALLERRGARTVLITTQGFRDVLEIGRQARENLYAFHPTKPAPLLARLDRYEVRERLDWQGNVLVPLDPVEAEALLDRFKREGIESVAVCLLFAYLNPAHEQLLGAMARERGFFVSLSSAIAPEPREFERTSTTVANAFVMPVMTRYVEGLVQGLQELGAGHLRIMQSDGGALSAQEATACAVKTVLSGPAAGIVAAAHCGNAVGETRLLTFDMGGTSTDVALVVNGECPIVLTGQVAGLPLRTPMLEIHTVGAGGGSLATIDAAGGLRVGPQSAGASPGPVAYGRGEKLTVTDANLLLGRLPAEVRLAGSIALDLPRVGTYFEAFARSLGVGVEQAAMGVIEVANASMARALRHISVERGQEPAQFTLLSFGGAGGLHACALAESLGIRSILVPRFPGAFSALGLTLAEVRREYVSALPAGNIDWMSSTGSARIQQMLAPLISLAGTDMRAEGVEAGRWSLRPFLDLRYAGQSFDLRVPLEGAASLAEPLEAFHKAHQDRYGHASPREPVELVGIRLLATAFRDAPEVRVELPNRAGERMGSTRLFARGAWCPADVYDRKALAPGQSFQGPAVVLQSDATTFVAPQWSGSVDSRGNLRLTR